MLREVHDELSVARKVAGTDYGASALQSFVALAAHLVRDYDDIVGVYIHVGGLLPEVLVPDP